MVQSTWELHASSDFRLELVAHSQPTSRNEMFTLMGTMLCSHKIKVSTVNRDISRDVYNSQNAQSLFIRFKYCICKDID